MFVPLDIFPRRKNKRSRRQSSTRRISMELLEDRSLLTANLQLLSIDAPSSALVDAGQNIPIQWMVKNVGDQPVVNEFWFDSVFLSSDDVLDPSDVLVEFAVPLASGLQPGETYTVERDVYVKGVPAGDWYFIVLVDDGDLVEETSNDDNILTRPITLLSPDVDLTSRFLSNSPLNVVAGSPLWVSWEITNSGQDFAGGLRKDRIYLSTDDFFDLDDTLILEEDGSFIAGGSSITRSTTLSLPEGTPTGSYFLFVIPDEDNTQIETEEFNNGNAIALNVIPSPTNINLFVNLNDAPTIVAVGSEAQLSATLFNNGIVTAAGALSTAIYLSFDTDFNPLDDELLAVFDSSSAFPLDGSASTELNLEFTLQTTLSGHLYFLVVTDVYSNVPEDDETDNILAAPVLVIGNNLLVTDVEAPSVVGVGTNATVQFTVTNAGVAPSTSEFWTDRVYLSTDETLDESDILLGSQGNFFGSETSPLGPTESYQVSIDFVVPDLPFGSYFLLFVPDASEEEPETDELDNIVAQPILIADGVDLIVSDPVVEGPILLGSTIDVTYTVTNVGVASLEEDWFETIYLSDDDKWDPSDLFVDQFDGSGPLLAGGESTVTRQVSFTQGNPGTGKYLLVLIEGVVELDESNNVGATLVDVVAPDLKINSIVAPSSAPVSKDIQVLWIGQNNSAYAANSNWSDGVYLSTDTTLDASDLLVFQTSFPNFSPLDAGETYSRTVGFAVPNVASGTYYILVQAARFGLPDADLSNNVLSSGPITISTPDLVVTELFGPSDAILGGTINLSYTVANNSFSVTGASGWTDQIFLSDDAIYQNSDVLLFNNFVDRTVPLGPNGSYTNNITFDLRNGLPGEKFILVRTDGFNVQGEQNESNNVLAIPISVFAPDLIVSSATVPPAGSLGRLINVSFDVKNVGTVPAPATWFDAIQLLRSPDGSTGNIITLANISNVGKTPLSPNGTYTVNTSVTIPSNLTPGTYYLRFTANSAIAGQPETDRTNNSLVLPIEIVLDAVDLQVSVEAPPTEIRVGETTNLTWSVTNTGSQSAFVPWFDSVYLSTNTTLDAGDQFIRSLSSSSFLPLLPNTSYTRDAEFTLQNIPAGNYYLLIVADVSNTAPETNENNNLLALPVQIVGPDLIVESIVVPPTATMGTPFDITYTVRNVGQIATTGNWSDRVVVTTDAGVTVTFLADSPAQSPPLGPGESYTRTRTVLVPANYSAGLFRVGVGTDIFLQQGETNDNNNSLASTDITIALPATPDLAISNVVAPAEAFTGQKVLVQWTVTNVGLAVANGPWNDRILWESSSSSIFLGEFGFNGSLAPGESVTRSQLVDVPGEQGVYRLSVETDIFQQLAEGGSELNNALLSNPFEVRNPPLPDLVVTNITPPVDGVLTGQPVQISFTIQNQGAVSTNVTNWADYVFLSQDPNLIYLGYNGPISDQLFNNQPFIPIPFENPIALSAGESYTQTISLDLLNDAPGQWYAYVITDGLGFHFRPLPSVRESDEANNLRRSNAFAVNQGPTANLEVSTFNTISTGFSGQPIEVSWSVVNNGSAPTHVDVWTDSIYLSTDETLDAADILLGNETRFGALGPQEAYGRTRIVTLPEGISGPYYILVATDVDDLVFESPSELDNVGASTPITINLTPPPDLSIQNLAVGSTTTSGSALAVSFQVLNQGFTGTNAFLWTDGIYLSPTSEFDPATAVLLKSIRHIGNIGVNGSYSVNTTVAVPEDAQGDYFLIVVADRDKEVFELDREDNRTSSPLTITFAPPNLVVSNLKTPAVSTASSSLLVEWTVNNVGVGPTGVDSWNDVILYTDPDSEETFVLATITRRGVLNTGASYTGKAVVTLPASASGNGTISVVADSDSQVFESNDADNERASSIVVTPSLVNLVVQGASVVSSAVTGETIDITWTVENVGTTDALGSWLDDIYLSSDGVFSDDDLLLASVLHEGGLFTGNGYQGFARVELPLELEAGTFTLLIRTDHPTATRFGDPFVNRVFEFEAEDDNDLGTSIELTGGPSANLVVQSVLSADVGYINNVLDVTWTVSNTGNLGVTSPWIDAFYISYDQVFDRFADRFVGYYEHKSPLGIGQAVTQTLSANLNDLLEGPVYLFVFADVGDAIFERTGTEGNIVSRPTSVLLQKAPPIDLVVGDINIPTSALAGTEMTVTYTVTNLSSFDAQGKWTDALYLSTDDVWDSDDILLGRVRHDTGVGAGLSYTESLTAALPGVSPGLYRVILRTDAKNQIVENVESNNIAASLDSVEIDVPALELGVAATGSLQSGQTRYYRVDVADNQTLKLTLTGEAATGAVLFASSETLPTTGQFEFQAIGSQGTAQIVIPSTVEGTYYILLTTTNSTPASYSLLAESLPFGISSISNQVGGSGGSVTLEIEGAGFSLRSSVEMTLGDIVLTPTWVYVADSSHMAATFDLVGKTLGKYDVRVYTESIQAVFHPVTYEVEASVVRSEEAVLAESFEIVAGIGSRLEAEMLFPSSALVNRVFPFQFLVTNTGDNDIAAPVYWIDSTTGTPVSLSPDVSPDTPTMEQILIAGGRRRTVLAPGESITVTLYALAGSGPRSEFNFTLQSEGAPDEPIEWDELEEYYRADETDEEWATTWANFKSLVGTSWDSLYDALRRSAADQFSFLDEEVHAVSAGELIEGLLVRAAAGQSDNSRFYYFESGKNEGINVPDTPYLDPIFDESAFAQLRSLNQNRAANETPSLVLDLIEAEMQNVFGPVLVALFGSNDVRNVFYGFLNGSSASPPLPVIIRNGSDGVEGANFSGFKNSQTTQILFNSHVIPLIRQNIQKAVDEGKIGKGGGTFDVDMFSEGGENFPNGFSDVRVNYSKFFDIPGLIAGGISGSPYGKDNRKIEGTVTLTPKTDKCGQTTFDAKFDLRMNVKDAFDFVDGYLGDSPLVQAVTAQLRLLEANDRAYAVPIGVEWNVDINPIPKVATLKDDKKKPPKQPPANACNTVPPDPDCNSGPSAARGGGGGGGSGCNDSRPPNDGGGTDNRTPNDPNDIVGPAGYGPNQAVSADDTLAYTIRFENRASATAAARSIVITTKLDDNLDWSTFQLGDIAFSNLFVDVGSATSFFAKRLDLRATTGVFVDVAAVLDANTGVVTWSLDAIDPATGEAPLDPAVGVLPPNEADSIGEGFVTFLIKSRKDAATGDRIDAQARIVFDTEAPIDTPAIFNTIDASAPLSFVEPLPNESQADFIVRWSGVDDENGSGIASYDLYVSINGDSFSLWLDDTSANEAVYKGKAGYTYAFAVIATDGVGNVENKPIATEAQTIIVGGPEVQISGPTKGVLFDELTFTVNVTGGDPLTPTIDYLVSVDWNSDGEFDFSTFGNSPLILRHAFQSTGVHTFRVALLNEDGTYFAETIGSTEIVSFETRVRPDNPALTDLFWTGTGGDDSYRIVQVGLNSIRVETLRENGVEASSVVQFDGITGKLIVFTGGGDDLIDASLVTSLSTVLNGGDGNDTILGGQANDEIDADGAEGHGNDSIAGHAGDDVIFADGPEGYDPTDEFGKDTVSGGAGADVIHGDGAEGSDSDLIMGDDGDDLIVADGAEGLHESDGPGNDTVEGGAGRDILIGGRGADELDGGIDDDLILTGATSLDTASWLAIQSEWRSSRTLVERVDNIRGVGTGPRNNGEVYLTNENVEVADAAIDIVLGGADADWLLVEDGLDDLADFEAIDLLAELGPN